MQSAERVCGGSTWWPFSQASCSEKVSNVPLWQHILMLPVSSQVTVGLAKIFNFEILTHGTSITNSFGIMKNGADPSKGGSDIGSTHFYLSGAQNVDFRKKTKNCFYVFKDTEAIEDLTAEVTQITYYPNGQIATSTSYDGNGSIVSGPTHKELSLAKRLELAISPRAHAALSGLSSYTDKENSITQAAKIYSIALANFLFSPTIRFVYTLEETKTIFEDDPDYTGKAYKTSHHLPNHRIGLIGIYQHASFNELMRGVTTRPLRTLSGAVQLVAGAILTSFGLGIVF